MIEFFLGIISGICLCMILFTLLVWKIFYPRVKQTVRDAYAIGFQNGQATDLDLAVNRIDI